MILTGDWHLDDAPTNEYRWQVFDVLAKIYKDKPFTRLYHVGDISDRKDRHSSILVNRLVKELNKLLDLGINIFILIGNHDLPLNGPPFWQFLNSMDIVVATKPLAIDRLLLLPYAANPVEEWRGIPLFRYRAIFMHQTVTGVVADNGTILQNDKMPVFPRGIKIYSGDIHTPQVIGAVTYVGAPHHVKFGDKYLCRMLRLDDDYKIIEEIKLTSPTKHMIDVASVEELESFSTHRGDQARIRFELPLEDAERWPAIQDQVASWASKRGVMLASVEASIDMPQTKAQQVSFEMTDPEEILKLFAETEGIDGSMLAAGLALLKELE